MVANEVRGGKMSPQSRPLPLALARPVNIVYMVLCNYRVYVYKAKLFL